MGSNANLEDLYDERLGRYLTAMRNEKPDKVPIRPFVAEFATRYAGFDCQQGTHDYENALAAVRKCAVDFDWDALVVNMIAVWTGLTQAIGLKYYAIPGIDVSPDMPFQYREPSEDDAFMKADEYDELIADPTAFLYNVWLPRVSTDIAPIGGPGAYRNNVALVKGGMAMLQYFMALGNQASLLRTECGTVSAIGGALKAPFDILGDKLRGYMGLTMDMVNQPDKVLKACEALMPHMCAAALGGADPNCQVPVSLWMHRGCVPFVTMKQFESHYWPTVRPIIEELWKQGHQTILYAEGNWDSHLDRFAELPDQSVIYHVDQGDIFEAHRKLGHKFCLSGGIPNFLLGYRSPDDVRAYCKKVIEGVAQDGGYIMDASAIMQTDSKVENLIALTEATREYGVYSSGSCRLGEGDARNAPAAGATFPAGFGLPPSPDSSPKAGVCIPWAEKVKELPAIPGDAELAQRVWENVDALGNMFIWQCLTLF